jgi:NAD(P)-dependent dehydrogenase (short-subunit alcohol dehydrogenase family)
MSAPRAFLITGAGTGLGRAIALHLAAPGTRLLLHYGTNAAGAGETVAAVRAQGGLATLHPADLASFEAREALMDAVAAECPALQGLVNNAGLYPEAMLLETSPALWREVLEVNCSAVFHLTQRALPLLRAGAPARVINLGDSGADRITARLQATPYHVAKLGVHVLTRSFAKALAGEGITVNLISPGFLDNSAGEPGSPVPAGRLGRFEDVLGALDYLLSPQAGYVTGANLVVSGGWNL